MIAIRPILLLAIVCAVVGLGPGRACADQGADRPNIIFIIADDLGYGDPGCYGQQKIKTPRLDRMAAEGVRFTQHYSGFTVCSPSRCPLMTGKHMGHASVTGNGGTLKKEDITVPHGPHKPTPEDAAAYAKSGKDKAAYYGEIAGVDRAMGKLRQSLREMKVADNTMVWFCSDNGSAPPGSTGGLPGRKKALTEGGLRVPGILEWPARITKPFATSVPVCTTDFYPTAIDLLGVKMPDECGPIAGTSLLPLIEGRMEKRPKPIPFVDGNQTRLIDNEYSMVNGKLFRFADGGRNDIEITEKEPGCSQR